MEKPCIVYMCIVEIDEMNITSMNKKNDRIKTNEDLKKSFSFSTDDSKKSCFKIFLNFMYEKEFTVSFKSFLFH